MFICVQLWLVVLLSVARADDGPDLRRLFPYERDVFIERDGIVRLPVPPDVLAMCRGDLSDLRLFDRQDGQVSYAIDAGPAAGEAVEMVQTQDAVVVEARRETVPRPHAAPLQRETYVIEPPRQAGEWDLVFAVDRPSFVRRLDVAALDADGGREPLVAGGSLFRMTQPRAEKLRLALPAARGRRLAITLEGEDGGYLAPTLRYETRRELAAGASGIEVPLEELGRRQENGRTVVELVRPQGLVADALRIGTSTGSFNRAVEVWEDAGGRGAGAIGRRQIFRVQGVAPVEDRDVPVHPGRGERLRVEIDDGDSPPLADLTIAAVVRQPVLIAALDGAGARPAGTLRYGGGRAHAPHYDLAGLLPDSGALGGERAKAAAQLYDAARASGATLGPVRDNPAYDGAPALAFAMRPGATVDARAYTHRRALDVAPSPDGLSRIRLGAADLARTRPDLGDIRVVDAGSRQWPYLLQADAGHAWEELDVGAVERRRDGSHYRLVPATAPLTIDRLVLAADTRFVDRPFRLTARTADGSELALASGRLTLRAEQPSPLGIAFAPTRVSELELVVDDGDEAPLALRAARARTDTAAIFLVAPAGRYTLLLGNPDAGAPHYDLERARDVILAVSSGAASIGELDENPDYSLRARLAAGERLESGLQQVVLWGVLIAAAAVLGVITLRLARSS